MRANYTGVLQSCKIEFCANGCGWLFFVKNPLNLTAWIIL
ncbi:hypothetical protein HMPREF0027_1315 [Actinobacillus ureae ATCC 25976]|uniref:Uncharacterized protein n=1 Tax=Actinobacillus ureae ATCC 25976 TaxID=887324 RepID=E8KHJ8_9PAST|nr:hypothetical protein HMPREF0027_1315 [Actinobacillus ureae ATCC 25976]